MLQFVTYKYWLLWIHVWVLIDWEHISREVRWWWQEIKKSMGTAWLWLAYMEACVTSNWAQGLWSIWFELKFLLWANEVLTTTTSSQIYDNFLRWPCAIFKNLRRITGLNYIISSAFPSSTWHYLVNIINFASFIRSKNKINECFRAALYLNGSSDPPEALSRPS